MKDCCMLRLGIIAAWNYNVINVCIWCGELELYRNYCSIAQTIMLMATTISYVGTMSDTESTNTNMRHPTIPYTDFMDK